MSERTLYKADLDAGTQEQVTLLRDQQWRQIDRQHLIEAIELLVSQQRQELVSRCLVNRLTARMLHALPLIALSFMRHHRLGQTA